MRFLGSSSMVLQYGISGSFWYALGGGIHLIAFSVLSVCFKARAPGAKTMPSFIRARWPLFSHPTPYTLFRYGKEAHYVFIGYCFFTNFVVFAGLLVDSTGAINLLVKDLMPEFSSMLLAVLIGGYTIVGGLGGTFYVAYVNSLFMFGIILILQVFGLSTLDFYLTQGGCLSWLLCGEQSAGEHRQCDRADGLLRLRSKHSQDKHKLCWLWL
jgi:Na+/proline symporter